MGLRIATNVASLNVQRNYVLANEKMNQSMARMASGSRINKAADDAAGLSISEWMRSTIRSVRQANRNSNDGVSLIQTAEGGLNEIANMITRLRELGVQASSDTVGDTERTFIQMEVGQLKSEIERISRTTKWGKTHLIDGTSPLFEFQVGVYNDEFEDRIHFDPAENDASLSGLRIEDLDFTEKSGAQTALDQLDDALVSVNRMRSNLGALETRMHHAIDNLLIYEENMSAAHMRIRDTDYAEASSELARNQILLNAVTATQVQANSLGSGALKLIG